MPFTTYLTNSLMNEVFGKTDFIAPVTLYVGLSTTTPAVGGTNITEPAGNAYARVAVTNNVTNFPNAAAGAKSNGAAIAFPTATGSWGTVTYFVIYDAASAGNVLAYGALNTAQTVANGDTLSFAVSAMSLSMT